MKKNYGNIALFTVTACVFMVILFSNMSGSPKHENPKRIVRGDCINRLTQSTTFVHSTNFTVPEDSEIHPRTLEFYRFQARLRYECLQYVPDAEDFYILYNVLAPEVFCKDLVRIGKITDGGKWICNPVKVMDMKKCTIYSLGIHNDPSFERDFQIFTENKCLLRSVDKGEQRKNTLDIIRNANGIFKKALLTNETDKSQDHYTFKDLLVLTGDKRIDILKIDIEGFEYKLINELVSVPICQILIEIHGDTALKHLQLLRTFSEHGFYLFSYEINGAYHRLSEYSLINEKCFQDYGVKTIYGKYLS